MRVYVAGSSADLDFVRFVMAELESAGLTVVHDWVKIIEDRGEANPRVSKAEAFKYAQADLDGVAAADIVVLVTPLSGHTIGAWWECGYADKAGIPIYVLHTASEPLDTIFAARAECVVYDIPSLLNVLEDDYEADYA